MTDLPATHAYIIVKPCGCIVSVCVDEPSLRREIARMASCAVRKGYALERLTIEDARIQVKARFDTEECQHDNPLANAEAAGQLPLFEEQS